MSILDWPIDSRPREKLIYSGAHCLSTSELLAIFIRTGIKGKSALALAHDLLNYFGNLHNLLNAHLQDFCKIPGLGEAKYAQLQAVLELNRRYLFEELSNIKILKSSLQTRHYLISKLGHQPQEIFACLFLNNQHHIIDFVELFQGDKHEVTVPLGPILKAALQYNASGLIAVHNHPSGCTEPSQADIELTENLQKALYLIDIKLIDHFIVGKNHASSLAELGYIL